MHEYDAHWSQIVCTGVRKVLPRFHSRVCRSFFISFVCDRALLCNDANNDVIFLYIYFYLLFHSLAKLWLKFKMSPPCRRARSVEDCWQGVFSSTAQKDVLCWFVSSDNTLFLITMCHFSIGVYNPVQNNNKKQRGSHNKIAHWETEEEEQQQQQQQQQHTHARARISIGQLKRTRL